ncbi:PREDICTED: centromere protein P [Chrysochloris asiatica]|uniref:Centromere protein P n=1 Tax=Chrysochloris asiatica TaxID=185453 RepID=A0A9B0U6U9_CHRAS|nr:PREDICTED: centromere protein P [Chrysochloris asiatica]
MAVELSELLDLEAEIATLRRACEEPTAPLKETSGTRKLLKNIYQSESEGWEPSKDLRRQVGHLESELALLSTLVGINIKKYSKKTEDIPSTEMTQRNIRQVLQRHRLSGSCRMVTFQLEFQILEIQNEKTLSSVITDLNIIVEPTEYSELSEFVSRAEERRDLFMFFRSLHLFVKWCEFRKRTFKHFKDKYDDNIHMPTRPESCYMGIQSPSQPGFELIIIWRIQMDDKGKVLPTLDLLNKFPKQALKLDRKAVTASAPHSFRTLLGMLGIEASLESLIHSFLNTKE